MTYKWMNIVILLLLQILRIDLSSVEVLYPELYPEYNIQKKRKSIEKFIVCYYNI